MRTEAGYKASLSEQLKHVKRTRADLTEQDQFKEAKRITDAFVLRMYGYIYKGPEQDLKRL